MTGGAAGSSSPAPTPEVGKTIVAAAPARRSPPAARPWPPSSRRSPGSTSRPASGRPTTSCWRRRQAPVNRPADRPLPVWTWSPRTSPQARRRAHRTGAPRGRRDGHSRSGADLRGAWVGCSCRSPRPISCATWRSRWACPSWWPRARARHHQPHAGDRRGRARCRVDRRGRGHDAVVRPPATHRDLEPRDHRGTNRDPGRHLPPTEPALLAAAGPYLAAGRLARPARRDSSRPGPPSSSATVSPITLTLVGGGDRGSRSAA